MFSDSTLAALNKIKPEEITLVKGPVYITLNTEMTLDESLRLILGLSMAVEPITIILDKR